MCAWSNPANTGHDARELLNRTPLAETLKATQLWYLQVSVLDLPIIVQEDLDLSVPFQTCDWIYGNSCHDTSPRTEGHSAGGAAICAVTASSPGARARWAV